MPEGKNAISNVNAFSCMRFIRYNHCSRIHLWLATNVQTAKAFSQ
jgi:hypothetical protein